MCKKLKKLISFKEYFENQLLKEVNKEKRKEIKENILFFKNQIKKQKKDPIKWTGVFNK